MILPLLAGVMACNATPPPPAPPSWLEQPKEYPWGDQVASAENRLARHVTGALGERYGRASERHVVAGDAATLARLRDWYRAELGEAWRPIEIPLSPGEIAFGFARGDEALVVASIAAQADGRVPVTIFHFSGAN
jgi:hypothetical protein